MRINIIGIDCATNPADVGIAFGRFYNGHTVVERIKQGSRREKPADIVASWLKGQDAPTLLALDAPLGWPNSLAEELSVHTAGKKFTSSAHNLFRRTTDIFIKEKIGKQSLDVGADRRLYPKFPIREKLAESGLYWFFVFFIAHEIWPGFAQEYLRHQL